MLRPIEGEVDQPVIDEIDRLPVRQQPSMLIAKRAAVGDHRVDAVLLKQPLRQEKLRIEVLLGRPLIDDRDPSGRAGFSLQQPLLLEHAQGRAVEIVGFESSERDIDLGAAGPLRLGQERVEEGAAGIRVHLDQLRTGRGEVEVVAHEGATRSEVGPRDLRSPGQDCVSIAWQLRDGLDGLHHAQHLAGLALRDEDRNIGEEMRPRLDEARAQRLVSDLTLKRLGQRVAVERDAEAFLVQTLWKRPNRGNRRR